GTNAVYVSPRRQNLTSYSEHVISPCEHYDYLPASNCIGERSDRISIARYRHLLQLISSDCRKTIRDLPQEKCGLPKILPDKELKKLLGSVILDGNSELIGPNSIELRLGKHVKFHSTGEERDLNAGSFLKVH